MDNKSKSKSKSKSGVGKSGLKRMNKKEASGWFQGLPPAEQLLMKSASSSSSSSHEERNIKKEMHERERELILNRRSEHEARMKAQVKSKEEITTQIRKCKELRSRLIPFQMKLAKMQMQMQLHDSHNACHEYTQSSHFQFKVGMLECGISYELGLIQKEERVLFDMHEKHHCIKKSITDIIAKTTALSNPYTRIQAKNYADNVYKMVTV